MLFCQLTKVSECGSTSRNFSSTSKSTMKPVPFVINTNFQTFGSSAVTVFRKFGESKAFITTGISLECIFRPVTSLGHQEGEEFSERGPNFLNYVQHIFPGVGEKFSRGSAPPLVTGLRILLSKISAKYCTLIINTAIVLA